MAGVTRGYMQMNTAFSKMFYSEILPSSRRQLVSTSMACEKDGVQSNAFGLFEGHLNQRMAAD